MSNESALFLPAAWFPACFSPQPSHLPRAQEHALLTDFFQTRYAQPPSPRHLLDLLAHLLQRRPWRFWLYRSPSRGRSCVNLFILHSWPLYSMLRPFPNTRSACLHYSINCSFLSQLLLLYLSPILCLTSPCDNQTPSQHRLCFFFLSYHQQNRISDKTVRSRLTGMTACCDPFLLLFKNDLYLNFVYF